MKILSKWSSLNDLQVDMSLYGKNADVSTKNKMAHLRKILISS